MPGAWPPGLLTDLTFVGAELLFQAGSQLPPPCAVHALLTAASLTSRVLGGKSGTLALLIPGALEALG